MRTARNSGIAFIAVGVMFIGLGIINQTAFIGIGAVFFILGIASLRKSKR